MAISSTGKKKIGIHGAQLLVTIIVLALSARVNQFQEFFFAADLFPLALSIISLVLLAIMQVPSTRIILFRVEDLTACYRLSMDFALSRSYNKFEIGILSVMTVLWLVFSAFSTSRWVSVSCGGIPDGFDDVRVWCRDLQALKAFVWIEWLAFLFSTLSTIRLSKTEKRRNNTPSMFQIYTDPYA
uniref:MARVEL domain-containing protein n=1 Tax=Moniliophthora roreri TaxID=221103 RepID=A0A0W0FTB8_MONRR